MNTVVYFNVERMHVSRFTQIDSAYGFDYCISRTKYDIFERKMRIVIKNVIRVSIFLYAVEVRFLV